MRGLAFVACIRHVGRMRLDTLLLALSTFFATLGPADLILVYAALTERNTRAERQLMAFRGVLIAWRRALMAASALAKRSCRVCRSRQSFVIFSPRICPLRA